YNGSSWRVERIYLVVTAKELNGKVRWSREVTTRLDADALETTFFSLSVTGDQGIGSTEWSIERAFGHKSDAIVPSPQYRQVRGPDGTIDFPASMSDSEILEALRKLYPPKAPKADSAEQKGQPKTENAPWLDYQTPQNP